MLVTTVTVDNRGSIRPEPRYMLLQMLVAIYPRFLNLHNYARLGYATTQRAPFRTGARYKRLQAGRYRRLPLSGI